MFVFVLVISTLVFPGVGHVTLGRTRRGVVWAAATVGTLLLATLTVWAIVAWLALRGATIVDLIVCARGGSARPHYAAGLAVAAAKVLVLVAIRLFVLEPFGVPSTSMVPTVVADDDVLVSKLPHEPERGDVIAFHQPCEHGRMYLKRVVALAGDTVEIRCEVLYVNGAVVAPSFAVTHEPASNRDGADFPSLRMPIAPHCTDAPDQPIGTLVIEPGPHQDCAPQAHFVVPANSLFVLGDNRINSNDSRFWGAVSTRAVVGRAVGIITPAHFGDLR